MHPGQTAIPLDAQISRQINRQSHATLRLQQLQLHSLFHIHHYLSLILHPILLYLWLYLTLHLPSLTVCFRINRAEVSRPLLPLILNSPSPPSYTHSPAPEWTAAPKDDEEKTHYSGKRRLLFKKARNTSRAPRRSRPITKNHVSAKQGAHT